MFEVYGGGKEFNQWSLDQKVVNSCMEVGDQVVFRTGYGKIGVTYARADIDGIVADVPNELLKYAGNMMVELGQGNDKHDDCRTLLTVLEQEMPEDYVCVENKVISKHYVETVKQDLTEAEKAQARRNIDVGSWNDLTDKPFGESSTGGDTLTWDGNTNGLVSNFGLFYKVSDAIVTIDDLANGFLFTSTYSDGSTREYINPIEQITPMNGILFGQHVVFVSPEGVGLDLGGVTVDEVGVYLGRNSESYVSSVTISGYTGFPKVERMDEKYMPTLTSPNGTKWKLTVDDSGNISATEI